MKALLKLTLVSAAFGLAAVTAGCEQPRVNGAAEKAGEKIDNAMDDATKSGRDLTDGAAENAGEALDKAAGNRKATDQH